MTSELIDIPDKEIPGRKLMSPSSLVVIGEDPEKDMGRYVPALLMSGFEFPERLIITDALSGSCIEFTNTCTDYGEPMIKFNPGFTVHDYCEMVYVLFPCLYRKFMSALLITGYQFLDNAGLDRKKKDFVHTLQFSLIPPKEIVPGLLGVPVKYTIDIEGYYIDQLKYHNIEILMEIGEYDSEKYRGSIGIPDIGVYEDDIDIPEDRVLVFLAYRELWRFGFIGSEEMPMYKEMGFRYLREYSL